MKIHTMFVLVTLISIVAIRTVHAAKRSPSSTPPPTVVDETTDKPVISPK